MSKPIGMWIRGTGRYLPEQVRTNADYARVLETTDEWIFSRSGIRERRIAAPGETTSSMGAAAARAAMKDAQVEPCEIDMILCATITGNCPFPATANFIQQELGLTDICSFDVSAACSGFVYALITGASYLQTGRYRNILVIGAETLTRVVDQEDRGTAVLFGDGAGAAVISPPTDADQQLVTFIMGVDAERTRAIWIPAGGTVEPASLKTVNERLHYMRMQGREVFKYAIPKMVSLFSETLAAAELTVADLAVAIPHQSNARIIDGARERLAWPREKVYVNIDRYGNTSAASIPIALDELRQEGRLKTGDLVLLLGLGAGITYATALIRL